LAYKQKWESKEIIIILNFSKLRQEIENITTVKNIFSTHGKPVKNNKNIKLTLRPFEGIILKNA